MLLCSLGIRFASSRAAGAQLLPRRQPTWRLEAREDRKQQNGKEKEQSFGLFISLVSGSYLSSRAVASQVLSAYKGLTSVFGMGTGGTPSPLPPEISFQGPRFRATLTTAQLL